MLHYVYIKFRARYFHYVSMPTEILSQDFISEFHLLFQQRFTQIFDEVTRSPQLSVIPGTNTATLSPDKWYGTSEFNYIFSSYNLYTLFFYTQNVKIYSDSFHIRFVQRGDLWKQTTHQLQMGGTEFHRVFLSDVFGDYIPSFHYPGRSAKQIFQTGSDWKEWWTLFNLSY